jgi:signal transduction histidine kinase
MKCEVDDEGVIVSVSDTGTGIHSEVVERIFAPLFTTKSDGMGMGLSICRSIIEGHDGRSWFDPNKPEEANFRFKLLAGSTTSADAPRGGQIQQM